MQLNLVPHPTTPPADPAFAVWATVEHVGLLGSVASTNLWFGVSAPLSRFRVAEPAESRRAEGLWETTCFEAFLRRGEDEAYREWNFAPSSEWEAYDFSSWREGRSEAEPAAPPYIRVEDNFTWWALGATIAVEGEGELQLGLSAIIEERDGTKSYWALAHPPGDKPDFHAADCFAAKLP